MKATRAETQFVPVVLTLETQAEVDAVHALLDHVTLLRAVGLPDHGRGALIEFRDWDKSIALHLALCAVIKPTLPAT